MKYFGTDGIRGIANIDLTPELAYKLARSVAYKFIEENEQKYKNCENRVLIGKDTRKSGDMLEAALVSGFTSMGFDVYLLGVCNTPSLAALVRKKEFHLGVMISASHNTYEYNGLKVFKSDGFKLPDDLEFEVEKYIDGVYEVKVESAFDKIGIVKEVPEYIYEYCHHIKSLADFDFEDLNISIDTANGSNYKIAEDVFKSMGIEKIFVTANTPNGLNINKGCGSTVPSNIQKEVIKNSSDIGFAFDGDADRLIAVDEDGEIVDGDIMMGIIGRYLHEQEKLNGKLVLTVMSNLGIKIYLKSLNIDYLETQVGDKYVLEEIVKNDLVFGGEQSGHIIYLPSNTTGDGLQTAVLLLNAMKYFKKSLKELKEEIDIFPQILINAKVDKNKQDEYLSIDKINKKIKEVEEKMQGSGRVLIRPSGTEPVIRVMIEGKDISQIEKDAKEIAKLYEEELA